MREECAFADDLTLLEMIGRNKVAARGTRRELNQTSSVFDFGKDWLLEFEATSKSLALGLTTSNLKKKQLKGRHIPCSIWRGTEI